MTKRDILGKKVKLAAQLFTKNSVSYLKLELNSANFILTKKY